MADGDGPELPGRFDRRRFLTLTGSTAAAIAGCFGEDSGGNGTRPRESDSSGESHGDSPQRATETVHDAFFTVTQLDAPPEEYDWNPLTEWTPPNRYGMFTQWTQYLVGEDRFHPHLIEDWEHLHGETRLTLAEAFTWAESGDAVTAADLALQLDIYDAADHYATRFLDDWTAVGRFELSVTYPPETNTDLVEFTLLPLLADIPPANWAEADWESTPAEVTIRDPDASGPFYLTEVSYPYTESRLRDGLDSVGDHALADHYNWHGYRLKFSGTSHFHSRVFSDDDTDGMADLYADRSFREQLPDTVQEYRFPAGFGMGLWFDHDRELWQHREARQAFLHAIDREAVIEAVGSEIKHRHPAPTGLSTASVDRWLGSSEPAGFETYDGGAERARELLDQIGYEPADVDVTVTSTAMEDWTVASETIVEQLDEAGWGATLDLTGAWPVPSIDEGDFDVAAHLLWPEDTVRCYHPFFALEFLLQGPTDEEHFANYEPGTVSVDGERVDVNAELDRLASTTARDDQRQSIRRLARVVNEDVPCVIVMEDSKQSFIDTEQFDVPADSPHAKSHWPQWWLPKVDETLPDRETAGLMKYVPEENRDSLHDSD